MATLHPKVDDIIDSAAPFASPILIHLRLLIHTTCPDVEETIKWGMPNFMYKGTILCGMAAHTKHCSLWFWLGSLLKDPKGILRADTTQNSMGQLGRITSLNDLPGDKELINFIKQAMQLIDKGDKIQMKVRREIKELPIPEDFESALKEDGKAYQFFKSLSPAQKNEYINWIEGAKQMATREKRLNTSVDWCAEGKRRNWKYER